MPVFGLVTAAAISGREIHWPVASPYNAVAVLFRKVPTVPGVGIGRCLVSPGLAYVVGNVGNLLISHAGTNGGHGCIGALCRDATKDNAYDILGTAGEHRAVADQ